jgi:hypothetical protein
MLGFMSGDLKGMEENFRLSGEVEADAWTLKLEPRKLPLNQILSHIDLEGWRYLSHIQVVERSGNRTDMYFSEISEFEAP